MFRRCIWGCQNLIFQEISPRTEDDALLVELRPGMPANQSVNKREKVQKSSDGILGPPYLYDPGSFGISFLYRYQVR
jgi:hypothetical protein